MRTSKKKAAATIKDILQSLQETPENEKIAVTWYEVDRKIEELKNGPITQKTGVQLGFLLYMKKNLKEEPIALSQPVLDFLFP